MQIIMNKAHSATLFSKTMLNSSTKQSNKCVLPVIKLSNFILVAISLIAVEISAANALEKPGKILMKEECSTAPTPDKKILLGSLQNDSLMFKWWKQPPIRTYMKLNIFNITNIDAFISGGEKPVMIEKGPYVYRGTWEKVNIKEHTNGTISYNLKKNYDFDPESSIGPMSDLVYTPHLPMRKNGTGIDVFTVFNGIEDITKTNIFVSINENETLNHYKTKMCNRLDGSDGLMFPPLVTPNTTLYFYEKDFFRLLPLKYMEDVTTSAGIRGYRFTPPDNVFGHPALNPDNDCYCPGEAPCAPNGLLNVSSCLRGHPFLVSFPHFYLADPKLLDGVEGVSPPDPEKDRLYIDIHPETGIALSSKVRIQINMAVNIPTSAAPDVILPVMWYEEGFDQILDEAASLLKRTE